MNWGDLKVALGRMVAERDWDKFHTPENLAKSISIESAELLEHFQWGSEVDTNKLEEELADVLTYCFLLAQKLEMNPQEIVLKKLEKTQKKYPVEKSKGSSIKYDRL